MFLADRLFGRPPPRPLAAALFLAAALGCAACARTARAPVGPISEPVAGALEPASSDADTHYAFTLVPKDGEKRLCVVMDAEPLAQNDDFLHDRLLRISVYEENEQGALLQQMQDKTNGTLFRSVTLCDVDFDGDTDFFYRDYVGAANYSCHFWIWDAQNRCFTADPYGLNELSMPRFSADTQTIDSYNHGSAVSGVTRFYRYRDGALVCIRSIDIQQSEGGGAIGLTVTDDGGGGPQVVYQSRADYSDDEQVNALYDAALQWQNLEYHGDAG